jgi:hypothetical protein
MASEDSDQVLSGRLPIHRFDDLSNLNQTFDIEMSIIRDQLHAACELLEVTLLRRSKRVILKERNYRPYKIIASVHDELAQMLSMVVLALIDVDPTHAKEALELLQCGPATDTLRHDKPMRDLVPGPVASATPPAWLPDESDGEASLSVYKASDPAKLNQSFLLISCTRHVVTVPPTWDGTRSAGFSGFPAYSQMLAAWLPIRRAAIHLRTVIVTAAVYRGLASLLRTEVLTTPRNLPAPGRRQPLYVVFRLSRDLCFW